MAARRATTTARLAGEYLDADDGFPCADFSLLVPLKRSREYATLRRRVADPKPLDAWQVDQLHYFVFELRPVRGADGLDATPVALFVMASNGRAPTSVLLVGPGREAGKAQVTDLRRPDAPFTIHL